MEFYDFCFFVFCDSGEEKLIFRDFHDSVPELYEFHNFSVSRME